MKKSLRHYKLDFLDYLSRIRGYSELTLKTYDDALNEALGFIETEEKNGVFHINLMPYRLHIASRNPKTISKKLSAIRSFAEYLRSCKEQVELLHDESIKVPKTLPKPLAHEHIMQALEHADDLERMVITLLYTTGMRISELSSLECSSVDEEWVRVVGKGKKQRDIPLPESTARALRLFIDGCNPQRFVFEKSGQRLSENSLRYIVKKAFKKVGIKATPHQLRHSYATVLLNNSARIADVSELLGHASMATTQIYTKLGNALKLEHYMKSHPLCKGVNDTE